MRARNMMRAVLALALGVWVIGAQAQLLQPPYTQGKQYQVIAGVSKPAAGNSVVVQEFFWYGCPHCSRLDPMITSWVKTLPKGVVFQRVPDSLGRQIGVVHEQAFYIAKQLGILAQTHAALFDAIHVEDRPMATLHEIRDLYVSVAGIDPGKFDAASSSIAVQADVKQADDLAMRDRIDSVPTLVIGGYYKTNGVMASSGRSDQSEADSFKEMLKIATYLVNKLQSGQ